MILDRAGIEALLPHRDPFLFVDRVVELDAGERAVAEHDVLATASWVPGHFPADAVMPGVLIAEAMAQTAALAYLAGGEPGPDGAVGAIYLVGYDKLRFRKPVRPGSVLRLEARLQGVRRRMATFEADAFVGEDRVANGTLIATVP